MPDPKTALCPICKLPLSKEPSKDGVTIDICLQCWGIWLDGDELAHVYPGGKLPKAIEEKPSLKSCPRCDGLLKELTQVNNLKLDQCPTCHGLWFDSKKELLALRDLLKPQSGSSIIFDPADNSPDTDSNPKVNLLALPMMTVVALLVNTTFLSFFLRGFYVWIHEFGHAVSAWLCGFRALPLPFGWTSISLQKSWFVYWGILFLLAVIFYRGWKAKLLWLMILSAIIAGLQYYMTWVMSDWYIDFWFIFGGVGGEFYLSTLLIVAFYFKLPQKLQWNTVRFIVLFIATCAFWDTFLRWISISHGQAAIPFGTLFGGIDDAAGDMDQLMSQFQWSGVRIARTYRRLGEACLFVQICFYVFYAIAAKSNPRKT